MEQQQYQQTPEQKEYKAAKERFRTAIKGLAAANAHFKQQRKTIHYTGVRQMEPHMAAATVRVNATELRHLYIAYAIFRGKEIPENKYLLVDNKYFARVPGLKFTTNDKAPNMDYVTKLLQTHGLKTAKLS